MLRPVANATADFVYNVFEGNHLEMEMFGLRKWFSWLSAGCPQNLCKAASCGGMHRNPSAVAMETGAFSGASWPD